MTSEFPALGLILLFPLLGVIFNIFFGRRASRDVVGAISTAAIFAAFAFALWSFATLLTMPSGSALTLMLWPWIVAGRFHVDIALRFDALSAVMVLVVSGVGAFIHLYSVGYMAHDEDYSRYFAYMNLFALVMLVLVLANNLLLMFIGWEGVGLCSYLLIAFWYDNPEFAYNGREAFIANRIGDAGFILGILTIVAALGAHGVWTLTFTGLEAHPHLLGPFALTAGLLLFLGATGKSAQIPLYIWLPDAMVGPTPVSALIHAATMVTAGVYMIARLNFLYMLTPDAMEVVAIIGGVTSFFAATVAVVQPDIKRVLAYSTISQIGYMMLGVGVGAFAAGIFHLMTHAFFKGLLFLCAGSIIHALQGEQDMNKMGGLWNRLPITYATMLAATLSICAIPPFAGYFSKDQVLEGAFVMGHFWLWLLGVITAALTGLYMFRLIFMTFHGSSRLSPENEHHVHESPRVMTVALVVLGVFSVIGGWVWLPDGILWGDAFKRFLDPVFSAHAAHPALTLAASAPSGLLSAIALVAALIGIAVAWIFYIQSPGLAPRFAESLRGAYTVLMHKYYIDEFYNLVVTRPLFFLSTYVLYRGVDSMIIDGIVDATGLGVEDGGEGLRRVASGNVQHYAFVYLLGAIGIAAYYLYLVMR
ncbi:MAG: NADH-quinone oxidoreductase subunit L [Candidatus Binataceae bacterium]